VVPSEYQVYQEQPLSFSSSDQTTGLGRCIRVAGFGASSGAPHNHMSLREIRAFSHACACIKATSPRISSQRGISDTTEKNALYNQAGDYRISNIKRNRKCP
jgi:hypothetical protein